MDQWGVVSAERYDRGVSEDVRTSAMLPGARSILVVASGGALWEAFLQDLRDCPRHLSDEAHPVDAFVRRRAYEAAESLGGMPHRWFWADENADVHLDFRSLAVSAGIGAPSRLGLVLHPTLGPWLAIRAAVFLPVNLPESAPVGDLCGGCAAPCMERCPGSAFASGAWDARACVEFHYTSAQCSDSCASRRACPVGSEFAYTDLQELYHSNRKKGRVELSQVLDIEDNKYAGEGPF